MIESLLFPVVAGLISVKVALLAAAVVLFVLGMLERSRRLRAERAPAPARYRRLDIQV